MLRSTEQLQITDFGAGSHINNKKLKKVRDIVRNSAKSPKYGQLLFRLAHHLKSEKILELGTSLGISSLYLGLAVPNGQMITLEGCPETAAKAADNFAALQADHIQLITGEFSGTLPQALQELGSLDLAFIDGNHQKQPTLDYFGQCLEYAHNNSLFIFDDIHWSTEMEEAWQEIKDHPAVSVSIDLFFMGLVFFRKEQAKEHFVIRI